MILLLGRSSSSSAIQWSIPWKRHRRWRDKSSWRSWSSRGRREVNVGSNHCKLGRRQWCWKVLATAHEEGSKKEHCHDEKEAAEALASYEGGSSKIGQSLKRIFVGIDPVRELMITRQNSTPILSPCDTVVASLGGGDCDVPPPFQQFCSIRRG